MKIGAVSSSAPFCARNDLKGVIYVKPIKADSKQQGIIEDALNLLDKTYYDHTDILYMRSMGVNPPFESGHEAVEYLKKQNVLFHKNKPTFKQ